MRKKKVTPETEIKKMVKQYLQIKGWFVFPVLQGLGAHRGISDMIACKGGTVLFVEIKTPKGTLSENQVLFKQNIEIAGCRYLICRGLDDLFAEGI